jgi:hypothetical protein
MSKYLTEWTPSAAAIDLVKLNGCSDEQIAKCVDYLKSQNDLHNIDDIDGYDNWDAFFIMFCIKANRNNN